MPNQSSMPPRPAGPSQFSGTLFAIALLVLIAAVGWWQNQSPTGNADSRTESVGVTNDETGRSGAQLPDEHEPALPQISSETDHASEAVTGAKKGPAPDPTTAPKTRPADDASRQVADHSHSESRDESSAENADKDRYQVPQQTIRDLNGKIAYKGTIDLKPTLDRIERGDANRHRNDGTTFQNREGRLPKKSAGYYKEYVHPTPGVGGPGPQRIILGREHEIWYTPDHYKTFLEIPLKPEKEHKKPQ